MFGISLTAVPALAQPAPPSNSKPADPPPPQPGQVAVPRGADGAIIKAAPPEDAPKPGQPTMPRPLNYTPPDYPPEAKKLGLTGTVTLQLDIDKQGKVQSAVVIEPLGHGFDESAVAAARKLDFEPARRADGTAFAARILYRYSFTLKAGEPASPSGKTPAVAPVSAENFRGLVLTTEGDVPLAGAVITIIGPGGQKQSVNASPTGAFAFEGLSGGALQVEVSAPGYETLTVDEDLGKGELTEVKYRLVPKGGPLEVVIRGDRPPREVTKRTIEQREINRIPGTNGDALRSIQNLPGVARTPGGAGVLLVRGSGPQDTLIFVDGTPVPIVYHFGGLSSVIPTEMLEKIDFYPGNFSAQYGRASGGIVDVGIRSPKEDGKYHGLAQVDVIDARAMLEGPVPLLKSWRFAAAGRRSYLDAWLGPVLTAAGAGVTQAPVYYDYQFLAETNPTADSKFRAMFIGSDDGLALLVKRPSPGEPALTGNIGLHTAFQRLQLRYSNDLSNGDKLRAVIALGQDGIEASLSSFFFVLDLKTLTGRLEYSHTLGKGATLNTGLDIYSGLFKAHVRIPAPPRPGQPPNQPFSTRTVVEQELSASIYQPAAYAELELAPTPRARIVPGARLDYLIVNNEWVLSPRVNGRYDLISGYPRTTLKGGVGVFHQPPQVQESIPPFGNSELGASRALHYGLGVEQELTRRVEVSVEGFYKQLDNLIVTRPSASGPVLNYANAGKGYAVGSEVLLKYKPDERFFGWLAYTLSRSARIDRPGADERLVNFDQPHILTVLGSYKLGNGWEFGARFRLVSGNLVTPNVCYSAAQDCDQNRIGGLFHAASGVYTPIPFSGPASERLPLFHQLDIRVDKRWQFKSFQLSMYFDVQNIYNNGNVEGIQYNYNYTARQFVSGLPILPSFGMRGEF
jgi:TonB family protein